MINGGHVINQWSMRKFTALDLSRTGGLAAAKVTHTYCWWQPQKSRRDFTTNLILMGKFNHINWWVNAGFLVAIISMDNCLTGLLFLMFSPLGKEKPWDPPFGKLGKSSEAKIPLVRRPQEGVRMARLNVYWLVWWSCYTFGFSLFFQTWPWDGFFFWFLANFE